MSRSLSVHSDYTQKIKLAVKRNGYPRQKDLAEDLQISLATISNYLNGKPVDHLNFIEISERLSQDWKEITDFEDSKPDETEEDPEIILNHLNDEEKFLYVERPPIETSCYEALLNPGALVRIKAPNLMGKTSLIMRTLKKLAQKEYQILYLNFHLAKQSDFISLDQFLKWFCISAGQSMGVENRLADYWDEQFSTSKVDCTDYFEKYLLTQSDSPLVLCLDEVDRIFPHQEVVSEFMGLLRAWHEQAKIRDIWKKVRIIIAHSTEVYVRLDANSSPFNVGLPIELKNFTLSQVQELAKLYSVDWSEDKYKQLIDFVGGHPHLLEQAFSHLKVNSSITLENLLQTATIESGIYRNHLLHIWRLIKKCPELIIALKKVVTSTSPVFLKSIEAYKLHSMGLVSWQENNVVIRCHLYKEYFCQKLIDS